MAAPFTAAAAEQPPGASFSIPLVLDAFHGGHAALAHASTARRLAAISVQVRHDLPPHHPPCCSERGGYGDRGGYGGGCALLLRLNPPAVALDMAAALPAAALPHCMASRAALLPPCCRCRAHLSLSLRRLAPQSQPGRTSTPHPTCRHLLPCPACPCPCSYGGGSRGFGGGRWETREEKDPFAERCAAHECVLCSMTLCCGMLLLAAGGGAAGSGAGWAGQQQG